MSDLYVRIFESLADLRVGFNQRLPPVDLDRIALVVADVVATDLAEVWVERDAALESARNYRAALKDADRRWAVHLRNEHP